MRPRPVSGFVVRFQPQAVHGEGEWARPARSRDQVAYVLLGLGRSGSWPTPASSASGIAGPALPCLPAGERGWRERLGEVVGTLRGWWSSCGRLGQRGQEALAALCRHGRVAPYWPRASAAFPPGLGLLQAGSSFSLIDCLWKT